MAAVVAARFYDGMRLFLEVLFIYIFFSHHLLMLVLFILVVDISQQ